MSINDVLALIFKSSMYVMKIVKTKIQRQKLVSLLYIPLLLLISNLIFYFHQLHFKNNLVTNNKHIW